MTAIDAGLGRSQWKLKAAARQMHPFDRCELAFSPDSGLLAYYGPDSNIRLWDTRAGKLVGTLDAGKVSGLAFNPNGTLLASAHQNGTIRLWGVR
jgi:WD40 repeat protein